jgi:hypothetical protein
VSDTATAIKPQPHHPGSRFAAPDSQMPAPPAIRPRPTYADVVAEDDAFFEKLLGDAAYFFVVEFMKLAKMSHTSVYRGMAAKAIPYIWIGHRRAMTRAFTLHVLRHGLRPFSNQAVGKRSPE